MKFVVTFLSLLFLLLSCSATGMVDCEGQFTYNTDDFTPEQQTWIVGAAWRWNTWVGRKVVSVRPGNDDICNIRAGETKSLKAIGEEHEPTVLITIELERMERLKILNQTRVEAVIMHEIGHALGFSHVGANGKALMAPAGAIDFTEIDRIECIKLGICTTLK